MGTVCMDTGMMSLGFHLFVIVRYTFTHSKSVLRYSAREFDASVRVNLKYSVSLEFSVRLNSSESLELLMAHIRCLEGWFVEE